MALMDTLQTQTLSALTCATFASVCVTPFITSTKSTLGLGLAASGACVGRSTACAAAPRPPAGFPEAAAGLPDGSAGPLAVPAGLGGRPAGAAAGFAEPGP